MKPAYQTVIFDIDGTLLKSDRGVMNALKYTTERRMRALARWRSAALLEKIWPGKCTRPQTGG